MVCGVHRWLLIRMAFATCSPLCADAPTKARLMEFEGGIALAREVCQLALALA